MIIVWIIIIALLAWGVVALARRGISGPGSSPGRTPLDIARERYARGEITKEEFERLKKDLV